MLTWSSTHYHHRLRVVAMADELTMISHKSGCRKKGQKNIHRNSVLIQSSEEKDPQILDEVRNHSPTRRPDTHDMAITNSRPLESKRQLTVVPPELNSGTPLADHRNLLIADSGKVDPVAKITRT